MTEKGKNGLRGSSRPAAALDAPLLHHRYDRSNMCLTTKELLLTPGIYLIVIGILSRIVLPSCDSPRIIISLGKIEMASILLSASSLELCEEKFDSFILLSCTLVFN